MRILATYSLGHTDTGITDGQGLGLLVGDDVNAQVLARVELAGVGQGLVADLVQGIGGVGNKFSQEDFLVGVDGVDDEREKLRDLSLELESLSHCDGYLKENCLVKGNVSWIVQQGVGKCESSCLVHREQITECCEDFDARLESRNRSQLSNEYQPSKAFHQFLRFRQSMPNERKSDEQAREAAGRKAGRAKLT